MLKTVLAAGLMLSPTMLLAQPAAQLGNGMGTQADAAPHSSGGMTTGTQGSAHRSTMHHTGKGHTTRGASLSRNTPNTQSTSNSNSGPLNAMPH